MNLHLSKLFHIQLQVAFALLILIVLMVSAMADDKDGFPELKGRFKSKTLCQPVTNVAIDYAGKMRILFTEGLVYKRTGDDPIYDYFYIGEGEISIIDSAILDNVWGMRFGHKESVKFTTAYICGNNVPGNLQLDSTQWKKGKINGRDYRKLTFQTKAPDKYFGIDLECELGIWSDKETAIPPIWIDAAIDNNRQMVLSINPDVDEQLALYLYDELDNTPYQTGGFSLKEFLISQPINVDTTIISIILKESGRFEASGKIIFPPGTDKRGISLVLPDLNKVDSVIDATGKSIPFRKKQFRSNCYISQRSAAENGQDNLTIYYRGKFIAARINGYDYPATLTTWFPQPKHRNLGQFIVNYTLHKDLTLNSVGTKISERIEGDYKTITYQTDIDVSYISFASGKYALFTDSVRGIPVTLYIEEQNNIGIFNRGMPYKVLSDITEPFDSFYEWFGPPLLKSLKVVDRYYFGAQSSPGLIHLPVFIPVDSRGRSRMRAHEVAHQWWGHTAIPGNYRDYWLSEGLSEYSAYLYILNVKHDSTACRNNIKEARRYILEEGKIGDLYSRGYRAGSIAMGARFRNSYSPGDYIAIVYCKAAYMLRMLHFELDGPEYMTGFFLNMLAEYRQTHYGKHTSNVDFIRVASHWMGAGRADEFFGQWLYDWSIPEFECRYRITPNRDGLDLLNFEIDVFGVSPSFSTPFPIEIEFAGGAKQRYRVDGVGQRKEFELGPFPQKIKKVKFNPDDIILCKDNKVIEN